MLKIHSELIFGTIGLTLSDPILTAELSRIGIEWPDGHIKH